MRQLQDAMSEEATYWTRQQSMRTQHYCLFIDNIQASWIGNSIGTPQSINVFVLSLCAFRAYNFD